MIRRLLFSFGIFFLFLDSAAAQWVNVAPNLLGNFPNGCCAFGAFAYKDGITWVGRTDLFKSLDSGQTWTPITTSGFGSIDQIDFFDKNTGLVLANEGFLSLTTDGGNTWTQIHNGGEGVGVSFCGSANKIILASDYSGIFYSTDQGQNWNSGSTDGHILCCIGRKDGAAFVHNESVIRRTTDFGQSWQTLGTVDYDSWSMTFDSSSDNIMYLMNEEGHVPTDNMASVFRSTDGGNSWSDFEKHQGTFFSGSLAVSKNAVFAQTLHNGVMRSSDQGQTWSSFCGGPSNNIDSRTLCAINDNLILAVDPNGSIWRYSQGSSGNLKFSISSRRLINDSLNVTVYLPIYLKASAAMPALDFIIHYPLGALAYQNTVSLSGSDVDVANGAWAGRAKVHFSAADLSARKDSLIGWSLFTWMPYEYDCSHITFDSLSASVSGGDPCSGIPKVLATGGDGYIGSYPSCGLARETDVDAPRFTIFQNKNSLTDSIEVDDGRATDEGLKSITWKAEAGTDTNKIKVLPPEPPILACYNDKQNHIIQLMRIDTNASGCYDFTFIDCLGHESFIKLCIGAQSGVETNTGFILSLDIHPNPFLQKTTVTYSIGSYANVKLYLYDALGKEVARLFDGAINPGTYTVDFDGSKLPSGDYIARLEGGGAVVSRRVVIER